MNTNRFIVLTLFFLFGKHAVADKLVCPAFVESVTALPKLEFTPDNGEAVTRGSRLWLDGAIMTLGHPKKITDLKPEPFKFNKKIYEWQFSKQDNEGEGIWFSCSYNQDQVLLTRKLTGSVSACRLIYPNKSKSKKEIILDCE